MHSDPNHPECPRSIVRIDSASATVSGADAAGGEGAACDGGATDVVWGPLPASTNAEWVITVDFSSKGGPAALSGAYSRVMPGWADSRGYYAIEWTDGNEWTKMTPGADDGTDDAAVAAFSLGADDADGASSGSSTSAAAAADDERAACALLGGALAYLIQAALGVAAIGSLVYKRHVERPQRPWAIWGMDVGKQLVGGFFVHFANIAVSALVLSGNGSDECAM